MKKRLLSICKVILILLIIVLSIGITTYLIKAEIRKKEIQDNIEYIYNIYNNDNSQEIFQEYITNQETPGVEIQTKTENIVDDTITTQPAVAVLEIPKIEFKDIVFEGTTQDVLANGIGLFEHSPILNGNVCLAGHNTSRFFKRLNELEIGDTIKYLSCLGMKEYVVSDIQIISETDWQMLESTEDNRITIITCVKDTPEVRLCVQAIEKI